MVIPPTICAAPKSLLIEMFKKSEDNDTWRLDYFKKDVSSIDFHRILAEDCHGNWLEQQLSQQRRLHPTMMDINANEVIKWLDVIIIFHNHIFMPPGTIARWNVYMNFKGKGKKDTSTMVAQREVAEIPLVQVFLGGIVTQWRVRMDYKKQLTKVEHEVLIFDFDIEAPTAEGPTTVETPGINASVEIYPLLCLNIPYQQCHNIPPSR
ncbi:hypothetical protein V6N13_059368 [Hibiscus sabdariffa]